MENKPSSLWPAVALVAVVVAGVVLLSALHVDTSTLVSLVPILVVPLLAYLIGQVSKVQHQTNGNTSALLEQNRALTDALAQSVPASSLASAPVAPVVLGPSEPVSGASLDYGSEAG